METSLILHRRNRRFSIFNRLKNLVYSLGDRSDFKRSLGLNCGSSYSSTCLKLDIVNFIEGLNEKGDINIVHGLKLVRENVSTENTADLVAHLGREHPNNPDARLDAFLLKKLEGYLASHSLKLDLMEDEEDENAVTGRKKKRKGGGKGGMGMIFAAAAMMKSTLFAVGLGTVAALAGKALMTAMISLLLSTIIGLKSLKSGGGKSNVEVVHASSHDRTDPQSYYQNFNNYGNGRSLDAPLPLGLRADYKPA
ncbi:unnamed protein product [Phyllotreta striolata]|uniref:Uncharacterized protein n=1 Tax=Phyllotreta striolata TaxID=444603 RepID=A0A9N9TKU6_PHYSR|nr:unnamed protein product [Phyllotreta striolata]